jgi:hypothetical protein
MGSCCWFFQQGAGFWPPPRTDAEAGAAQAGWRVSWKGVAEVLRDGPQTHEGADARAARRAGLKIAGQAGWQGRGHGGLSLRKQHSDEDQLPDAAMRGACTVPKIGRNFCSGRAQSLLR